VLGACAEASRYRLHAGAVARESYYYYYYYEEEEDLNDNENIT